MALHRLVSLYRLLAIALYVAAFTTLPDDRLLSGKGFLSSKRFLPRNRRM